MLIYNFYSFNINLIAFFNFIFIFIFFRLVFIHPPSFNGNDKICQILTNI